MYYILPFFMDDFDILAFPTNHHRLHLPYTLFVYHHGKTNPTNPHSEPTRRSNRTAGKSPASELPAACKLPAAHKPAAARKATAASPSHGDSKKFSGECKGLPEAMVPAPEAILPCGDRRPNFLGNMDKSFLFRRKESILHLIPYCRAIWILFTNHNPIGALPGRDYVLKWIVLQII